MNHRISFVDLWPLGQPLPEWCVIVGCDNRAHTRALCEAHYKRWQRTGHPLPQPHPDGRARLWHDDAACLGLEPAMFFPHGNEDSPIARRVCAECPVTRECLDDSLQGARGLDDTDGIRGGTTQAQRKDMRRAGVRSVAEFTDEDLRRLNQ